MPPLLERLEVELPVVQAGMGGGLSRHELAAAVSEAGGLGTIAVNGAESIRRELAAAGALTGPPLAHNTCSAPRAGAACTRPGPGPTSSSPSGASRSGGPAASGCTSAARSR